MRQPIAKIPASASFSMNYRHDADNIAGAHDGAAMAYFRLKF